MIRSAGLVILVAASLASGQTARQRELGTMAASLYIGKTGTDEFLRPYLRVHSKAIALFKPMGASKLRELLSPVYKAFKPSSIEAIGCAYVMGLYGADSNMNLGRMVAGYQALWKMDNRGLNVDSIIEAMPEAIGDITIRQNSGSGLSAMFSIETDGAVAETAESELVRIWVNRPLLWRQYVGTQPKRYQDLVDTLANAYTLKSDEDGNFGRPSVMKGFVALQRVPTQRAWANRLLSDVQAAAKKLG